MSPPSTADPYHLQAADDSRAPLLGNVAPPTYSTIVGPPGGRGGGDSCPIREAQSRYHQQTVNNPTNVMMYV